MNNENFNKTSSSIADVTKANKSGYFGIGVFHPKNEINIGTLLRSAQCLGASFVFTIGKRYKKQSSDTLNTWKNIPIYNFKDFDDFYEFGLPYSSQLIGIELTDSAEPLPSFEHPIRACYLLGAEDHGLAPDVVERCHRVVYIPSSHCFNVSVSGSIVMYDRIAKNL